MRRAAQSFLTDEIGSILAPGDWPVGVCVTPWRRGPQPSSVSPCRRSGFFVVPRTELQSRNHVERYLSQGKPRRSSMEWILRKPRDAQHNLSFRPELDPRKQRLLDDGEDATLR